MGCALATMAEDEVSCFCWEKAGPNVRLNRMNRKYFMQWNLRG